MSAAARTKIFGMRIGVDPKILVGGLVAIAALLFWLSSRTSDDSAAPTPGVHTATPQVAPVHPRVAPRRTASTTERTGSLRLRPIDATRGDIDPTLRLEMLLRLQFIKPLDGGRNLFESGAAASAAALAAHAPIVMPKPPPPAAIMNANTPPVVNIPLKYYGFVRAGDPRGNNRGLFLDGDNVLVASEGDLLKQRYLIVELRDATARLEDVQLKQGQTLPVIPVALP